jgi:hypothetical protein
MIKATLSIVSVGMFIVAQCGTSREFVEFYKLPESEQTRQFAKFPIEKQIDFHLQAMSMEPPEMKFAQIIADQGDIIIPPVLARLKTDRHDRRTLDYMLIFKEFCRRRNCEQTNPQLLSDLEKEIVRIEDPFWREKAEKDIALMRGAPVPFPTVTTTRPK